MDGHGTWESPCGRNGGARPRTRSECRDGATYHNGAIHRPRGWHWGSHPSVENKEERINISFIEQRHQTRTQKKPPRQHVNPDSASDRRQSHKTLLRKSVAESGKLLNSKVIDHFETFPKSTNTPSYAQRLRSYGHSKLGRGIRSRQIKLSRQFGTLRPLATEFWKSYEYQNPREYYNLSNEW
jgi:hypothetical protein